MSAIDCKKNIKQDLNIVGERMKEVTGAIVIDNDKVFIAKDLDKLSEEIRNLLLKEQTS